MKTIVIPTNRAAVERAAAVTDRLREEDPESPIALAEHEAICPSCNLAYWVAAGSWGVCSDCVGVALTNLPI